MVIDHTGLNVSDFGKSRAFYVDPSCGLLDVPFRSILRRAPRRRMSRNTDAYSGNASLT